MAEQVSLADLLRYKDSLGIQDPNTGNIVKTVWIRVLGDLDLTKSYKAARLASAAKRLALRNPETDDYKDEVLGVVDMTLEEQKDLIKTANLSNIVSEAAIAVTREEPPKVEEFAVEPDAASLEELENFDKAEQEQDTTYKSKIDDYIQTRLAELDTEMATMTPEELLARAQKEVSVLIPFSLFMTELNAQKAFYGTFRDIACKVREFEDIEEYRQLPKSVQDQITNKMSDLEIDGATIKN